MAVQVQEKIFSLKWVPAANQVHRLSHLAFFMQSREVKSIGAFSLVGLEHGNFNTKVFETTRVWKGDSKAGNRQLFRLLRWKGSPTLKRAMQSLKACKRKPTRCSKCKGLGHKKNMSVCPLYNPADANSSESDEETSHLDTDTAGTDTAETDTAETDATAQDSSDDESGEDNDDREDEDVDQSESTCVQC